MTRKRTRFAALALAAAIALAPTRGEAIPPMLLLLVKQMVQQAAQQMIKDALLSSLNGMGCKGMALANALEAFDLRRGGGFPAGLPKMPAGMAMPGMPAGMAMPGMPAGMAMPKMPAAAAVPMAGAAQGGGFLSDMAAKLGSMLPGAGILPSGMGIFGAAQGGGAEAEGLAKMQRMLPDAGKLPPGMTMDPEQMAMMTRMQQSMSQPLSPPETLATIDELFELGFLPKAIRTELHECMLLVPATIPALGAGMGMLRPMIPQIRQARDELRALSPEEQDEIARAMAQELKALSAEERKAVAEFLDGGFFPPRVSAALKAGLAGG